MAELENAVNEELEISKKSLLVDEDIYMVEQVHEVEEMEFEEWLGEELSELDIEMTTKAYE